MKFKVNPRRGQLGDKCYLSHGAVSSGRSIRFFDLAVRKHRMSKSTRLRVSVIRAQVLKGPVWWSKEYRLFRDARSRSQKCLGFTLKGRSIALKKGRPFSRAINAAKDLYGFARVRNDDHHLLAATLV